MSLIKSVTLILFVGSEETDQQIWQAVRAMGQSNWRAQVLLVDQDQTRQSNGFPTQRITYRPIPPVYPDLEQAIAAAKYSTIAIPDLDVKIDPPQWAFLASQTKPTLLQTAYCNNPPLRGYKRILFWFYALIVRVLLRTGKNELCPGLILFQHDDPISLSQQLSQFALPRSIQNDSPHRFETQRVSTFWRLNSRPVSEFKAGEPKAGTPTHSTPPNSKTILASATRAIRFWWNTIMFPRANHELPQKHYKPIEKFAASLLLMAAACFLLFSSLGFPLFEPDEARNSQLALNMVESGQWLSLSLGDENYWDKPPLQIWAIAATYQWLGPTPFATRFPMAVAGLLTVGLCLWMGKQLVGFRAAWLGSVLLLLTSGFAFAGRYATMDASLTATTTALLLFGYLAIRGQFNKTLAVAAGIACGLGLLIKGPVIIALCAPPLLAAFWLSGRPWLSDRTLSFRARTWAWFAVPAILIAAPWYVATIVVHPEFLTYFFWKHHFLRFSNAFNHREPFYFYWIGIFLFMFPASYLLPSVAKFLTSRKPENRDLRTRELGFLLLSAVWIIAFFSISESKLATYIVPAFPLICLLMGVLLERKIFSRPSTITSTARPPLSFLDRLPNRAPLEMVFWMGVISAVLMLVLKSNSPSVWLLAFIGVLVSAGAVTCSRKKLNPKYAWACFALVGCCFVLVASHHFIPAFARSRSIHAAALAIQSSDEFENAPVVFFGREPYGAGLSIDDSNVFHFEESETSSMVKFLLNSPHAIIVSSKAPMKTLRHDLPWTIKLEARENIRHLYLSQPNLKIMARQQAPPLLR